MNTSTMVLLVIASGAAHAAWNTLAKRVAVGGDAFMLVVAATGALAALPPAAWWMLHHGLPSLGTLTVVVLARALCEALYMLCLRITYRHLDLSLAYPVLRGSAPVVTTVLAVCFLDERPAALALAGLAVIVLAIVGMTVGTLVRSSVRSSVRSPGLLRGLAWALAVGCLIGTYNVIDKVGTGLVDPFVYLFLFEAVAVAGWSCVLFLRKEHHQVLADIRARPVPMLAGGLLSFTAYGLTLVALSHSYASYVAPLREVSIVFGALLGIFLLKERGAGIRLPAAAVLVVGLVMVGLAM